MVVVALYTVPSSSLMDSQGPARHRSLEVEPEEAAPSREGIEGWRYTGEFEYGCSLVEENEKEFLNELSLS